MTERTTEAEAMSSPRFENLEEWLRGKMQETLQALLEEEVTEFLGRLRSQRRAAVDAPSGYRNGYGKPRHLTLSNGTIQLRRPRVRDTEEPFESRLLPMFSRRSRQVGELLPELYLHGLAEGDFDLALRGLLGQEAPLSASTVARLKQKWQAEMAQWSQRSLADLEVVYLWVDGIYVKAGLEKDRAAVLVVLGALSDGRKVVLTVVPGHRESSQSWSEVLRDLKSRGLGCPRLVAGDGHLGIWAALGNVYPEAEQQRCWNHKMLNVLDKLPKRLHPAAKGLLNRIVYAPGQEQAEAAKREFQRWCQKQSQEAAAECLDRDWDRLITFYRFPEAHWRHLRTTNPIESPFAALRLRTDAARRYKKVDNATAVLWKLLLVAEKRFRRLNAPEQLKEVFLGAQFVDGVRVQNRSEEEKAA
jgi:putative transposase